MDQPGYGPAHQTVYLTALCEPPGGGEMELRFITHSAGTPSHSDTLGDNQLLPLLLRVPKCVQQQYQHTLFIGACRRALFTRAVVETSWLWVSLKAHDLPGGKVDALQRVQAFSLKSTLLADLGDGYQALWRLKWPVSTKERHEHDMVERYLKRLCQALGGDPTCCEVTTYLQIPGTYTAFHQTQPLLTRMLELEPLRRDELREFNAVPPPLEAAAPPLAVIPSVRAATLQADTVEQPAQPAPSSRPMDNGSSLSLLSKQADTDFRPLSLAQMKAPGPRIELVERLMPQQPYDSNAPAQSPWLNEKGKRRRIARAIRHATDSSCTQGTSPPEGELWSLKQVASDLGISVEYARREWVRWVDEGVNPIRLHGKSKGALRFLKSEIVALTEHWRVQQA